jgi:hypothetical protein
MTKKSLETKRQFYIFSFTVLGLLVGVLVYGLGSLIIINKGYLFNFNWYLLIMLVSGTIVGFAEGHRWWRIIYVEKAYLKWAKHKHNLNSRVWCF